jgi:Streptomyces sporulation and cell division protein, SsgA
MEGEPVPAAERVRAAVVERETVLRLLAPDATGIPVRCGLTYDPDDPYAVHLLFHLDARDGEAIGWSFARELLAAGLEEPSGMGDVRIWPWTTPDGESVALALSSPDGQAVFEAPRTPLVQFLHASYATVPPGREGERLVDPDVWLGDQGTSGR